MKNEEKDLLLKDLCARLPYGVWVECCNVSGKLDNIWLTHFYNGGNAVVDVNGNTDFFHDSDYFDITKIKPYLRPMSSMTEEELNECVCQSGIKDIECPNWQDIPKEKQFETRLSHAIAVFLTDSNNVDWLNAHHFDFRNLVGKGLAIDCTDLNIY